MCDPHKLFPNTQYSAAFRHPSFVRPSGDGVKVLKEKKNKLNNKFYTADDFISLFIILFP